MKNFILFILFIFTQQAFAQFSITVSKTDETCVGNGTMTLVLENPNPEASYTFAIYKLPNTITTYLVTSSTFIEHLSNGTYQINAIETLNGSSTQVTTQVTIEYQVEPLQYYIIEHTTQCNGITIEVITTSGVAVWYEIFDGPVTYPQQESNIFHELFTDATYSIRIFDDCGEGYVRTHTVESQTSFSVTLDLGSSHLIDCDTYRAYFEITSEINASQETITYYLNSTQGTEVFTDIIDVNQGSTIVFYDFPHYANQTVAIGTELLNCSFSSEIDTTVTIDLSPGRNECSIVYFGLYLQNLLAPYTLEFTSYDGEEPFDPTYFNPDYPLHYENSFTYGMMDDPLPYGNYTFMITDSCGFTESFIIEVTDAIEDATLGYGSLGCGENSGYFSISFSSDRTVVSAQIISGPDTLAPFPVDISEFINEDGELRIADYPSGVYIVTFIDSCGMEHQEEIEIPEIDLSSFAFSSYVNCNDTNGTLRLSSGNGGVLTQAIIINAPAGFPHPLPYDATADIGSNGVLFYPNLPMGQYTIDATDSCGYHEISVYEIKGDIYNNPEYIYINKQCNIFDLDIDHSTVQFSMNASYWFQYYDEVSGEWVHPYTGVPYDQGTSPNENNSIKLLITDGPELLNVSIFGTFRIIKTFKIITSDSPFRTEDCMKENYVVFDYHRDLNIVNAYRIICEGQNQSVVIQAQGVPPLNYYITTKDGQPFVVNNGENNIFNDLEPGVYNFQVRDNCGNIRNREFNLEEIELMIFSGKVDDLISCASEEQNSFEFYLPEKNIHLVASTLALENFTFSYHLTYNQAYNNLNHVGDYINIGTGQTQRIFVRIENNLIANCFSIAYFDLKVIEIPDVSNILTDYVLCENDEFVTLFAGNGFDAYLWFDGSTSNAINVTQAGTYTIVVSYIEAGVVCENEITFNVIQSQGPIISEVNFIDWTYTQNSIWVSTVNSGDYLYSTNGVHYQESNIFENLSSGFYTIFVKDAHGCGEDSSEVLLLNYPRYFTPNGDGHNDFWRIELGTFEPEMKISIFDRYGKLLKVFTGDETGWDGTYNGASLPSTDYWFTVERKNGIIKRGHFSMLR